MISFIDKLDKSILIWIHENHSPLFDSIMPFITNKENWLLPIFILVILLGFKSGKKGKITLAILTLSIVFTDSICAQVFKPFFERLRPSHISLDGLNLLVSKGGKYSMPSNHAANVFTISVIITYFFEYLKIPMFIFATIIAFSRIYVGVHYPSDVVIGSLFGYLVGWTALSLWVILKIRELKRRQTWVWYESDPPIFKN
tara:strand:- start:3670 stop:4269 length:600 start_codon:yes stop_codon:yes gene_type:complete